MSEKRIYLILRSIPVVLLTVHITLKIRYVEPNIPSDLYLFNLISFCSGASILFNPRAQNRTAQRLLALAFMSWSISSFISTLNSFNPLSLPEFISGAGYLLFYPIFLFGLYSLLMPRAESGRDFRGDIFDSLIIGLGIANLCAGIAFRGLTRFFDGSSISLLFSTVYPSGDIVILGFVLAMTSLHRSNSRNLLILVGLLIFTITDLNFLWVSSLSHYSFTSIADDGWLAGLLLISEATWHKGAPQEIAQRFNSIASNISLLISAGILGGSLLLPHFFPKFVIFIAGLVVLLSFVRLLYTIHERKISMEHSALALTDELTGLANRRQFLSIIEKLNSQPGTLMILDLDGFKGVNDRYGHLIGDQLLKSIAHRFSRVMPAHSELARLGGDEFGAIIYGTEHDGTDTALALRATLSYPINIGMQPISIAVSIGQVFISSQEVNFKKEEFMRRADSAMYQAKRERSGVKLWTNP